MKTTLNVEDALFRRAKKVAAERGITLTALVEDALRGHLDGPVSRRKDRFRWIVIDDAELPPVDIADRDALHDFLEREG
ncbi:MAG TPA: DUF2191 domain-containing protein [Actinomycetota bacterium]